MDEPKPRRPWWKKKRWRLALALWLLAMYPLAEGPYRYCAVRGWVSRDIHRSVWQRPLRVVLPVYRLRRFPDGTIAGVAPKNPLARARGTYLRWWDELAREHAFPRQGYDLPSP